MGRHGTWLIVVCLLLAGASARLILAQAAADGGNSRAVTASAPSRPSTSAPASPAEAYPSSELRSACQATAERLRKRLDGSFDVRVRPPFVVAGNCPPARLEGYVRASVVHPAEVMWGSYFRLKPTSPITIILLSDGDSYRAWAEKLFGDRDVPYFGYCRSDGTMVMNIATGTGTLVHELTHALIAFDFPTVPAWFNEGLASLHEQCRVETERIVGLPNWRLPALQSAIRKGPLRPLRELVTSRDFYDGQKGLNYAQARYFVMYMQQQGLLGKFYETFRRLHEDRKATSRPAEITRDGSVDVRAIEEVFGQGIERVDEACRRWVLTLRFPG